MDAGRRHKASSHRPNTLLLIMKGVPREYYIVLCWFLMAPKFREGNAKGPVWISSHTEGCITEEELWARGTHCFKEQKQACSLLGKHVNSSLEIAHFK